VSAETKQRIQAVIDEIGYRPNGTQAQLWDCAGSTQQRWTYTAARQLQVYGNEAATAITINGGPGVAPSPPFQLDPILIACCCQRWRVSRPGR